MSSLRLTLAYPFRFTIGTATVLTVWGPSDDELAQDILAAENASIIRFDRESEALA